MSCLRLFGTLSKFSENSIKFSTKFHVRCMSAGATKHFKLKVVDNVGVIVVDSPGVKCNLNEVLIAIMTTNILTIGSSISIKRSDGRTQSAVVSLIDYELNCVKVEWFENGETKGKEIHFSNISALNPDISIIKSTKRDNYSTSCYEKIDDSLVNKNKRRLLSVGQDYRVQSAKPRLTQQGFNNDSSVLNELVVEERDRIERRKKQAEVKAEKVEICKKNQSSPHWELQKMISMYHNKVEFQPMTNNDEIVEHLITVAVRKRPLNSSDMHKKEIDIITVPNKNTLIVHEPKYKVDLTKYLENHIFKFDYTFNETCSNEMVYKYTAQPLVKTVFEGGFATCFAYGQTGSGKTYMMSGTFNQNHGEQGIYALAATDIFQEVNSLKYKHLNLIVSCSFFEIYVKKVFDLLNNKKSLKILEDGKQQVQVVGLTEKIVTCVNEVLEVIKQGNEERASGQTSANLNSSRSHAIFQIFLRTKTNLNRVYGKFSLIDLAGNERGADTFSSSKITRLEGSEINQSLLSLKECIRALGRKGSHLPFRGSKLTQVLRDSFVGTNSKTCMIAMVSPGVSSCENSLNTLRYADRVKELGGGDAHLNKSADDFNDNMTNIYSTPSVNTYTKQRSFEKSAKIKLEDKIFSQHNNLVEKLYDSAKEAENLLNSSKDDVEKYSLNWNLLIEDTVSYLLRAKI
ncbi:hypothetical protein NQ314_020913 [Rhamnusium bicolor]|uniref:Kinesin-like protein n=1 Tax=Rhamnusium bicolor TaxID=1586634 RepID=A0AAV8WKR7_9CUCU|nr:hypothetical protein NQ314_020913 [Rhamnusium bicolor]